MIQEGHNKGKPILMAFLDIRKAYDSVPWAILWKKCRLKGLDHWMISALQSLYESNTSQIMIEDIKSRRIKHTAGLLQGSVLSPLLYSIFIDDIQLALSAGPKLQVGNSDLSVNCLLYADDIAIIAKTPHELQLLLDICDNHSMLNAYRFNVDKCEIIDSMNRKFQIYKMDLKNSETFKYLGVWIEANGINIKRQLNDQANAAKAAAYRYRAVGICANGGFRTEALMHVYRTFARPAMEYCLAVMPKMTKDQVKILEKAQRLALSTLLNLPANCGAQTLQTMLGLPAMENRIKILYYKNIQRTQIMTDMHCMDPRKYNFLNVKIHLKTSHYLRIPWNSTLDSMDLPRYLNHVGNPADISYLWKTYSKDIATLASKLSIQTPAIHKVFKKPRCLWFLRSSSKASIQAARVCLLWILRKVPRKN
jgi:hypothetical protein